MAVDVPDDIIAPTVNAFFPLSQEVVRFDAGAGLKELRAARPTPWKEIRWIRTPMNATSQKLSKRFGTTKADAPGADEEPLYHANGHPSSPVS